MAQTFATNATEALVGVDDGDGAGADAVTDAGPADAGTDAVEEAGLKGSHKLSWQQASSQLVRSPVIFTKVHVYRPLCGSQAMLFEQFLICTDIGPNPTSIVYLMVTQRLKYTPHVTLPKRLLLQSDPGRPHS